jgi:hypothetical protein
MAASFETTMKANHDSDDRHRAPAKLKTDSIRQSLELDRERRISYRGKYKGKRKLPNIKYDFSYFA